VASFCGKCGSVVAEKAGFCGECGAQVQAAQSPQSQPAPHNVAAAVNPPVPRKSSGLLKVAIALVVVIAIGGVLALAAARYAAHKIGEKAHAVTRQVLGSDSPSAAGGLASMLKSAAGSDDADSQFKGDPCRFLSKEDVSHAVGVTIIRAQAEGTGCSYIAHGDPADMTSKHMTSMIGSQVAAKGETIDPKTKQMMQQITGAFFKQQESSDKNLSAEATTGEVPVFSVSFSTDNAELEMKMNRASFNHIKGGGGIASTEGKSTDQIATGDLTGIGDDAYEMGGTGLMVRKGKVLLRFMFPYCPCSADAIKPLAAKVANQL
jgi:hypothetical protein